MAAVVAFEGRASGRPDRREHDDLAERGERIQRYA